MSIATLDFRAALRELGATPDLLTPEERRALDEDGFVLLHGIVDAHQAEAMRVEMERLFAAERIGAGGPADCDFMEDRSVVFDCCLTHPRFLAAIAYVLREAFVSSGVHSRPNPPGRGQQPLHADWSGEPPPPGRYGTCNSIWMLSEFTPGNGATRVVPGTHLLRVAAADALADPGAPHPQEVRLCGPPGTVAVFNGHLWHSACLNRGTAARANVTSFWRRRDARGGWAAPELRPETIARLPPAARFLQVARSQVD